MRPISLQINAFGPYTEKVFLDFSLLEDQKIFIINGPTGSGKTTILDAMVYALYGKTSGGVRSGEQMRSDYADEELKTLVEFIFAIGEDEYKIVRSPKQTLKKKRGEGTREYPAEAAVFIKKDDKWDCIATKANDIRDWIQRIIGFREEQFLQVMLLPQGEFKKLLLASSAERASIMSELFHTEIYAKLQKKLSENLKDIQEKNIRFVNKTVDILENEDVANFVELEEKLQQYKTLLIEEDAEYEKLKLEKNSIEKRYKLSEKREELKIKIDELKEEQLTLDKQKEAIAELKVFVEKMKEFAKLRGYWQELNNIKLAIVKEQTQDKELNEELSAIKKEIAQIEKEKADFESTKDIRAAHEKELLLIQKEKENVAKYEKIKADLLKKEDVLKKSEESCNSLEKDLQEIATKSESLAKELKETEEIIEANKNIEVLETTQKLTIKEREKRDEEKTSLLDQKANLLEQEQVVKEKIDISEEYKRTWKALDFLYNNSKAYELAQNLEENKPCMVCGSLEHPKKAQKPEKLVNKGDLDKSLANYQNAKAEADRASFAQNEALKHIEAQLSKLEELEKNEPVKDKTILVEELNEILEKLSVLNQAKETLKKVKIEQDKNQDLKKEFTENLREAKEKYQDAKNEYSLSQKEKENLEENISSQTLADVEAKETKLINLISKEKEADEDIKSRYQNRKENNVRIETTIKQNLAQLKANQDRAKEIDAHIKSELEDSDMYLEEFCDYEVEYSRFSEAEEEYQDFLSKKDGLKVQLEAAQESLKNIPKDDEIHERLSEMFKEKEFAYEEQLKRQVAISKDKERIEKSYNTFKNLREENEEMQKTYEMVQSLSELANGGKTGVRGFTFENYVLRAILDEVLVAANERLKQMSQGRYTLTKAPVQNGGGGYQGLDLEIFDAFTGYARPANTLSGGETFLASLSLALGLADIVQSYAGGMHLDTIFVDEGFGTLDPETLEMALKAIIKLQEHGRLVGIISHVPELKERIPARLTVKKTARGSTAFFEV